jgi:hypothetical protein
MAQMITKTTNNKNKYFIRHVPAKFP